MSVNKERPCKDCVREGIKTIRPAPHPGPRCVTHHRAEKARRKLRAHALRVEADFGLTDEDYWWIYQAQGGHCFICRRATGAVKHLAVDHDHKCQAGHPPDKGCSLCVRALLCGFCNNVVGRLDPEALARAIVVLTDPPGRRMLDERHA